MRKIYVGLLVLGLVSIIFIGTGLSIHNDSHTNSEPVDSECIVSVNGEKILKQEIELVYNEFSNTGVTFDAIVENTIDEILAIQQTGKYDIQCSDEEVEHALEEYASLYPEEYEKAQNLYGIEKVKKSQKDRILYSKMKEYFFTNISDETISNSLVNDFIREKNLTAQLKEYSYKDIKSSLKEELRQFKFDSWIKELRKQAKIVYYE